MVNAKLMETVGPIGYNGAMNETRYADIPASDLIVHDVLVGSGFHVDAVRNDPDGRVRLIGSYPLSPNQIRYFSPTQIVTVRRLTSAG